MTTTYEQVREFEKKLAALMEMDLGVSIDPKALRLFLLHRWTAIALFSHAVHDAACGATNNTQDMTNG